MARLLEVGIHARKRRRHDPPPRRSEPYRIRLPAFCRLPDSKISRISGRGQVRERSRPHPAIRTSPEKIPLIKEEDAPRVGALSFWHPDLSLVTYPRYR